MVQFDFTYGFWVVLIVGAIALTVQEIVLYNRLHSLIDKIEEFYQLVVSSSPEEK